MIFNSQINVKNLKYHDYIITVNSTWYIENNQHQETLAVIALDFGYELTEEQEQKKLQDGINAIINLYDQYEDAEINVSYCVNKHRAINT